MFRSVGEINLPVHRFMQTVDRNVPTQRRVEVEEAMYPFDSTSFNLEER
jgi:hypothetical protein